MRRLALILFVLLATSAGCLRREGPAERAGRNIDEAAQDIGDAADDVADEIEDAAD